MTVYLVGAGPGDPGLLTVRGAEVLARADVVIYDRLSVASLLDQAPTGAEHISVGKAPGSHTMSQDEINALLVDRGRTGQEVVRLKGGDPFVFARGGEEAQALVDAGVAFEVVPGITSAVAAPAYAGIPVTLRHSSTSFTVVTGHEDPNTSEAAVDWSAVARVGGTIVVLMGVARWPQISALLQAGGLPADTPAAAVRWGTRSEQRTVRATLATLADQPLDSPSVIVVGEVATRDLAWFTRRPLFGQKVVVTRPRDQASPLVRRLADAGAEVVELPTIRIDAPADGGLALRRAVARVAAGQYAFVVFTSANGVHGFFGEVPDARLLAGTGVAAIGPGTAEALSRYRVVPDVVPERFVAESLVDAFPSPPPAPPPRPRWSSQAVPADGPPARRVLLARAAVARDVLPAGLQAMGWEVDVVEAYRTQPAEPSSAQRQAAAAADAITFTSSSTVTNYLKVMGEDQVPPIVACIGPVTARTSREAGLSVAVEAGVHTIDGLVDALVAHVRQRRPDPRTP